MSTTAERIEELTSPIGEGSSPAGQLGRAPRSASAVGQGPRTGDGDGAAASVPLTAAATFLSVASAGWMASGIFRGSATKAVALLGAALGVGLVALSYRTRRPSFVQYLALPAGVAAGAVLVLPDAQGGTANLPGLVAEAIRTGGVAQPPIPFDPGWRFILVLLTVMLGAGAASLATGMHKPKLGVFMPVPVLFGAALLQPEEGSLAGISVALALFVGSLAVAYGVELQREGATSGRFEVRRLARGVALVTVLVLALAGLSRLGFLFPETERDQVVPPKKPEVQPPQADRELFTVRSERRVPWRLGVLDVYDGVAWLLPPYDTSRFLEVPRGGEIPSGPTAPARVAEGQTIRVTFTVSDIEGHVVPTVANATALQRDDIAMTVDPRTDMLRLSDSRARRGMTYTVEAPVPPTGKQLARSGPPPKEFAEFLAVPPAPVDVARVLAEAPTKDLWNRLQFVRNAFYAAVVASGAGDPVDVPPSRVADMLAGGEATPFEITAAEVMLARWVGVPARVGYGFFGGDAKGASISIRPRHGATWLEAYFEGHGWIPIVGVPAKAKASLSQTQKNDEQKVKPSEELALIVYVPVKLQTIQLLFVAVRYWLARILPVGLGILLGWLLVPGLAKTLRRGLRRRWAARRSIAERIEAAYAEFRDVALDLNVGDVAMTPLEFRAAVEPDTEHSELAWLVTRALWGDLARDLRPDDAEAAEELARSVARRLKRGATGASRMLAFVSRASLRDPYAASIPNIWLPRRRRGRLRGVLRALARRGMRRGAVAGGLLVVVSVLGLSACVREEVASAPSPLVERLPQRIVPATFERFRFQREAEVESSFEKAGVDSLVDGGRVFTIRAGGAVEGYLQVAAFKPGLGAGRREVREGVLRGIGAGRFQPRRTAGERIYVMASGEQSFYLWFAPSGAYFELLVARKGFGDAERVFASLLAYQRGETPSAGSRDAGLLTRVDLRRGGEE